MSYPVSMIFGRNLFDRNFDSQADAQKVMDIMAGLIAKYGPNEAFRLLGHVAVGLGYQPQSVAPNVAPEVPGIDRPSPLPIDCT